MVYQEIGKRPLTPQRCICWLFLGMAHWLIFTDIYIQPISNHKVFEQLYKRPQKTIDISIHRPIWYISLPDRSLLALYHIHGILWPILGYLSNFGMPRKITGKSLDPWESHDFICVLVPKSFDWLQVCILLANDFVNGHRLQDDPHDMEIRRFCRI